MNITFTASAKHEILRIFDKDVDAEGYIVEKSHPTQRVLTANGEEIKLEEFAGFWKEGSVVHVIKSDLSSLLSLADSMSQGWRNKRKL